MWEGCPQEGQSMRMVRILTVGPISVLLAVFLACPGAARGQKKHPAEGGNVKMKFAPDATKSGAAAGPASKTLERALKLYDSEDFYSASIELHKVIEGESGDAEVNKQKAEFWMGKTLYNLKFYSASLSYFDRIVQKGPSH